MKPIIVPSIKATVPFRAGSLPSVDPTNPAFELVLDGVKIQSRVNAKAARKLAVWQGSAVLQGKLVVEGGRLVLIDAGFSWVEPKPVATEEPSRA
jgi:hypothetical protein